MGCYSCSSNLDLRLDLVLTVICMHSAAAAAEQDSAAATKQACSKPTHWANWLLMHRQGPQHCLAKCWLVSLFLRGSTACPTVPARPAASSSTHLLRLLYGVEDGVQEHGRHQGDGKGHRGRGRTTGGRRREGNVSSRLWRGSAPHVQCPRRTIAPPTIWQGPGGFAATKLAGSKPMHECTKTGGCSCIIKVPSSALRYAGWSALHSGWNCLPKLAKLPQQILLHPPAAPVVRC
jgi:hypothetical protein